MINVTIDDEELKQLIKKNIDTLAPEFDRAVKESTAYGLKETKSDMPKRTGNLRQSFQQRKIGALSREIYSESQYAAAVEDGAAAHVVRPKRAKMLTIPLRDSVLTSTKSQIKKSALDRLFRMLNKRNGKTKREIYQEAGIALAKQARIPRRKGKFILKTKTVPKIDRDLDSRVNKVLEEALR